jgi:hypothetical protein
MSVAKEPIEKTEESKESSLNRIIAEEFSAACNLQLKFDLKKKIVIFDFQVELGLFI